MGSKPFLSALLSASRCLLLLVICFWLLLLHVNPLAHMCYRQARIIELRLHLTYIRIQQTIRIQQISPWDIFVEDLPCFFQLARNFAVFGVQPIVSVPIFLSDPMFNSFPNLPLYQKWTPLIIAAAVVVVIDRHGTAGTTVPSCGFFVHCFRLFLQTST